MKSIVLICFMFLIAYKNLKAQDTIICCKSFNKQLIENDDFYKWRPSDYCTQYFSDSCIKWWKSTIELNDYKKYENLEVIYFKSANKVELFRFNVREEKFLNSIRLIFSEYLPDTYVKLTAVYNDSLNGKLVIREL